MIKTFNVCNRYLLRHLTLTMFSSMKSFFVREFSSGVEGVFHDYGSFGFWGFFFTEIRERMPGVL